VLTDFRLDERTLDFVAEHDVMVTMADTLMGGEAFHQLLDEPLFHGKRVADFGDFTERPSDDERLARALPRLDIAFLSGDQAAIAALQPQTRQLDCVIVVTLGASGSVALKNGDSVFEPALPVPHPVDSTGCGDAFQAAFTVSYLRDEDLGRALRAGAMRAAVVLGHFGATNGSR
jgi:sugar/nucleoside kinase (ribokinase family)